MSLEYILRPGFNRPQSRNSYLSRMVFSVFARAVRHMRYGRVSLTLPGGQTGTIELPENGPFADIQVRSQRVLWRTINNGPLGFAECYLDGDVETGDLADVFRFVLKNRGRAANSARRFFRARFPDRLRHVLRRNSRRGSQKNIAQHYDLGNAFYRLWLDDTMTYSSGYFSSSEQSLQDAQRDKNMRILRHLELDRGHSVLEIGCGWGGFVEAAGRFGAGSVTGVTISKEQYDYARKRVRNAELNNCDIRFQDYRDLTGTFDRIASIEMVEAVGRENWQTYFETIHNRLTPGGIAVLQAITIEEDNYDRYIRRPDFIQRYIFPGGVLPTANLLREHAERAGLVAVRVECFGEHYARTLWEWRQRFMEQWPRIEAMGFDERFRRMWDYYLTYCAVGFEEGSVDVGFYKFVRPEH